MRALHYIQSQPWMILPEYLDLIVEIASRERTAEETARGIAEAQKRVYERENSPAALAIKQGDPLGDNRRVRVREGVAVVSVIGPIVRYADFFSSISGATSTEMLARDFAQADGAQGVNSILLFVDSPGGEAFGIPELAQIIHSAKKPVTAYVGGYGASAAYYLASAAREVVIDAGALLGSIGTVMEATDYSKAYEQRGIKKHKYVSTQSPKKRPELGTESGDAQMQEIVDDLAQVFVEDVARFRGVSVETVLNDFGQGGLLAGQKAVKAGLADRVGSFEQLLSEMAAGKVRKKKARMTASETTQPATGENSGGAKMSLWDQLKAALSGEQPAAKDTPSDDQVKQAIAALSQNKGGTLSVPSNPPQESEEVKRLRAENEQLKKDRIEQRKATLKAEAETFINGKIVAAEVLPAVKEGFVAAYVQAGLDDDASPVTEGKSRVDMLKAQYEGREKHHLTARTVKAPAGARVLDEAEEDAELKADVDSAKAYAESANGKRK